MKEPLDSILSGGGEAVSGQTVPMNAEADASRAGEADSRASGAGGHLDAHAAEVDVAEPSGDGTRMVPHQALHAERQKVRRYTEEVADFRKALADTNAAFERRIGQLVEAIAPRPAPPDFFDNPEAATRHEVVQTVSPEFERINQTLHAFARDQAIDRFDEAKVYGAEQAFLGALRAGQLDPSDYRRVVGSTNRYAEAVRWHQRQSARAEIGDDPSAYKARLEAELREQILAELGGAGARFAQLAPSNLAGARNVGVRGGPAWAGPATLSDIFDRRKQGGRARGGGGTAAKASLLLSLHGDAPSRFRAGFRGGKILHAFDDAAVNSKAAVARVDSADEDRDAFGTGFLTSVHLVLVGNEDLVDHDRNPVS